MAGLFEGTRISERPPARAGRRRGARRRGARGSPSWELGGALVAVARHRARLRARGRCAGSRRVELPRRAGLAGGVLPCELPPPVGAPLGRPARRARHRLARRSPATRSAIRIRRPLYVYTPPGYDADADRRYPSVYVIQGMTGQLDMWRNRKAF